MSSERVTWLKQRIETYARERRAYHGEIEALARIQMMVGAREDTRIKHIILSNHTLIELLHFTKAKNHRMKYTTQLWLMFMSILSMVL